MTALPYMDVTAVDGVIELPRLKLRELLFVGALRVAPDGRLERDASRPLPPFRIPGLFPPGARFTRHDAPDGRVQLRRVDDSPRAPASDLAARVEAALGALREGPAWTSLHPPPALHVEHVLAGPAPAPDPGGLEPGARWLGLAEDGSITAPDAPEARHVLTAVTPGSAGEEAARRAGLVLLYARVVKPPEPEPEPDPAGSAS